MPRLLKATLTTKTSGTSFPVRPGETVSVQLAVAAGQTFNGDVRIEQSEDGGQTWQPAKTIADASLDKAGTTITLAALAATVIKPGKVDRLYRVRVERIEAGSDGITFTFRLYTLTIGSHGIKSLPGSQEALVTNAAGATALSTEVYESVVTSSGSAGNESATIGDGTGVTVGTRKLITFKTRTHASDVLVLDHANIVNSAAAALSAATIGTAGGFVFLEWNGSKWQVRFSANATLTAA